MVFFSHKFARRDICDIDQLRHRWRFAHNDARHRLSAASGYRHHELARPPAAFIPIFLQSVGFRSVLLCRKRSGDTNAGVSSQKVDCLARSVSRNIVLLEDKELATDLTHDRQKLLSQKHLTAVCAIDIHSSIDKNKVHWPQLGHTHGHHYWFAEGRVVCSRHSGATCLILVAVSA